MDVKVGDIMCAKVQGYADWPCVVREFEENKALVYFFGDRT